MQRLVPEIHKIVESVAASVATRTVQASLRREGFYFCLLGVYANGPDSGGSGLWGLGALTAVIPFPEYFRTK